MLHDQALLSAAANERRMNFSFLFFFLSFFCQSIDRFANFRRDNVLPQGELLGWPRTRVKPPILTTRRRPLPSRRNSSNCVQHSFSFETYAVCCEAGCHPTVSIPRGHHLTTVASGRSLTRTATAHCVTRLNASRASIGRDATRRVAPRFLLISISINVFFKYQNCLLS